MLVVAAIVLFGQLRRAMVDEKARLRKEALFAMHVAREKQFRRLKAFGADGRAQDNDETVTLRAAHMAHSHTVHASPSVHC